MFLKKNLRNYYSFLTFLRKKLNLAIDIDLGVKKSESCNSKIKRLSQIEKFNQRYSKN